MRRIVGRRAAYRGVAGVVASTLVLLAACLDDSPVAFDAPSVRATLHANVIGAVAGGTVRIRVGYRTRTQQLVPLPATPERIEVAPGTTVVLPLTVDIGHCLSDPERAPQGEPGCRLVIELTLSDAGGTVIDTQTREAEGAPATPGQAVNFGTITIGVQVSDVSVAPESLEMNVSDQQTLSATVRDLDGVVVTTAVTWTTSDPSVAQLNAATGATVVVTAIKLGSATITASAGGKTSNQVTVRVVPPAPLIIAQRPGPGCVIVGQTVTLVVDSPPAAVAWSIENPAIATIDAAAGVVTGKAAGTTTATATSANRSGTASVCVVGPLEVTPSSISVVAARTAQITASASGGALSFASSATSVATVNASGLVRGVGVGEATITTTLTAASGTQTATTSVSVTAGSIAISPTSATVPVGGSVQFTALVRDADGNLLPGTSAAWSVADGTIARLSATSGASVDVGAIGVGTTAIRASAGGATASASFTGREPLPAVALVKVSGDGASCATYSTGCTFVVRAVDVTGFPVAGAPIEWFTSFGCASSISAVTNSDGLAAARNMCSAEAPGKYTQTAMLLTNEQTVTFTYLLQGLILRDLGTDNAGKTSVSVTSSTTAASGLVGSVQYLSGPVSSYVTGLTVDPATTPATLTFSINYALLVPGSYLFSVRVTTTTPGIGPAVATYEFFYDTGADVQPVLRAVAASPATDPPPIAPAASGSTARRAHP